MHQLVEIALAFLCLFVVAVHPINPDTTDCAGGYCRDRSMCVKSGYFPFFTNKYSCETSFTSTVCRCKRPSIQVSIDPVSPTVTPFAGLSSAATLLIVVGGVIFLALIVLHLSAYFLHWQENDRNLFRVYRGRQPDPPRDNSVLIDSDYEGMRMERFKSVVSQSPYLRQLRKMHQTCRPLQLAY